MTDTEISAFTDFGGNRIDLPFHRMVISVTDEKLHGRWLLTCGDSFESEAKIRNIHRMDQVKNGSLFQTRGLYLEGFDHVRVSVHDHPFPIQNRKKNIFLSFIGTD